MPQDLFANMQMTEQAQPQDLGMQMQEAAPQQPVEEQQMQQSPAQPAVEVKKEEPPELAKIKADLPAHLDPESPGFMSYLNAAWDGALGVGKSLLEAAKFVAPYVMPSQAGLINAAYDMQSSLKENISSPKYKKDLEKFGNSLLLRAAHEAAPVVFSAAVPLSNVAKAGTLAKMAYGAAEGVAQGAVGSVLSKTADTGSLKDGANALLDYVSDPAAMGMSAGVGGIVGGTLGKLTSSATALKDLKDTTYGAKVYSVNANPGKVNTVVDKILDSIPVMGTGIRLKQENSIPDAIEAYVRSTGAKVAAATKGSDAPMEDVVYNVLQQTKARLAESERQMWAPLTDNADKIIMDTGATAHMGWHAKELLSEYGGFYNGETKKALNILSESVEKGEPLTFQRMQDIKKKLGSAVFNPKADFGWDAGAALKGFYSDVVERITDALPTPQLKDAYTAARSFSAEKSRLLKQSGAPLSSAIVDQAKAARFARAILSEKSISGMQNKLSVFSPDELTNIRSGAVTDAMHKSIDAVSGNFSVDKFLSKIESSNLKNIMGETYHSLDGFHKLTQSMAATAPFSGEVKSAIGAAAAVGGYFVPAAVTKVAGPTLFATAGALQLLAKKSPLKSTLIKYAKYHGKGDLKLENYYMKKASAALQRSGMAVTVDAATGLPTIKAPDDNR